MEDPQDIRQAKRFSSEGMQKVSLFHTERLLVDLFCLEPGQSQRVHVHHNSDQVHHVLEGRVRFTVAGEVATHGPGSVLLAPAGTDHGIENDADERLVLLVVRARDVVPGEEHHAPPEP